MERSSVMPIVPSANRQTDKVVSALLVSGIVTKPGQSSSAKGSTSLYHKILQLIRSN
ncbi:hypothetical protein LCGC14_0310640 [marine sediment metagenome]|uniref:Uncharacterized protein n=1 Tax=marine sediment metagenome TaxID=412755 RepID=A0A0F9W991_9ZZZZ